MQTKLHSRRVETRRETSPLRPHGRKGPFPLGGGGSTSAERLVSDSLHTPRRPVRAPSPPSSSDHTPDLEPVPPEGPFQQEGRGRVAGGTGPGSARTSTGSYSCPYRPATVFEGLQTPTDDGLREQFLVSGVRGALAEATSL